MSYSYQIDFINTHRKYNAAFVEEFINKVLTDLMPEERRKAARELLTEIAKKKSYLEKDAHYGTYVDSKEIFSCIGWKKGQNPEFYTSIDEIISMRKPELVKLLVERTVKAYDFLHPEFGYGDEELGVQCARIEANVFGLEMWQMLHWINFYGPKLVKKIGEKKLLNAPVGEAKKLSDGGIMLMAQPLPWYADDQELTPTEAIAVIKQYLGLWLTNEDEEKSLEAYLKRTKKP